MILVRTVVVVAAAAAAAAAAAGMDYRIFVACSACREGSQSLMFSIRSPWWINTFVL